LSDTPRRVLYVDDDEALRRLVARALTRRGWEVTLAAGGEEALHRAREAAFDVVALDHYMPGLNGFDTLQALRAELADPPPIVLVTGSDETRVAVAALKAGASDFVVKMVGDEFFDLLENAFLQALEQLRLRRKTAEAEEALRAGNQRLQTLLREVNHRVANSLQLVSAFVQLQAAAVRDEAARAALQDTQRRIEAVGQVHRRLYTSDDVESVDMQAYLTALVREVEETWPQSGAGPRLRLAAEPLRVGTDRAVSLGVIVNELITNACKYAYAPGQPGEVRVSLAREGEGAVRLVVEDDGRGLRPGEAPQGTGLGGQVIRAMTQSLGARLEYDPAHSGVRAIVRAPL
jgi:two-component sensor histidine kinase